MTFTRRAILRLLGAGAIGAATVDIDRLFWAPGQRTFFLPSPRPDLLTNLDDIAAEMARLLSFEINGARLLPVPTESIVQLGDTLSGTMLQHQYRAASIYNAQLVSLGKSPVCAHGLMAGLDLSAWRQSAEPVSVERDLRPIARALADNIRLDRVNVFASLPLPRGMEGSVASRGGISVRALRARWQHKLIRFDVIGGTA